MLIISGVGDVLEDASSTATLVSKNRSEDFLDNLSFNCSEGLFSVAS